MLSGRGLPLLGHRGKTRFTCWKLKPAAFVLVRNTVKLFQQVITQAQDVVDFCCSKAFNDCESICSVDYNLEVTDMI